MDYFWRERRDLAMKRGAGLLIVVVLSLGLSALTAWAASPVPEEIYPERSADGAVSTVARWNDGSYSRAISEYPEQRADGTTAYVWLWSNGGYSIAVRQYSERRADGSIWLVRQW